MIEFKNEYKSTRSGFQHISKLYLNNELLTVAKCNYINRTWEVYSFQSSMKKAVSQAIESEISQEKIKRGIKRLTKELKENIVNTSTTIQQLREKYKNL